MSPYSAMINDPIKHNDPNGDIALIDNLVGAAIWAVVEVGTQLVSKALTHEKLRIFSGVKLVFQQVKVF